MDKGQASLEVAADGKEKFDTRPAQDGPEFIGIIEVE